MRMLIECPHCKGSDYCFTCKNQKHLWEYPSGMRRCTVPASKMDLVLDASCNNPEMKGADLAELIGCTDKLVYHAWGKAGLKGMSRNGTGSVTVRITLPRDVAFWLQEEAKKMGGKVSIALAARAIMVDAYHEAEDEKESSPNNPPDPGTVSRTLL